MVFAELWTRVFDFTFASLHFYMIHSEMKTIFYLAAKSKKKKLQIEIYDHKFLLKMC